MWSALLFSEPNEPGEPTLTTRTVSSIVIEGDVPEDSTFTSIHATLEDTNVDTDVVVNNDKYAVTITGTRAGTEYTVAIYAKSSEEESGTSHYPFRASELY